MRLQVMHLPAPEGEYPFVLIVDQAGELEDYKSKDPKALDNLAQFGNDCGARAVLISNKSVELP